MTTTLLPVPRPSRLRPWARVLLWTVALVAALLGASVLDVASALSGGLDDLLDRSGPAPGDAQVTASLARASEELRAVPLPVAGVPLATGEGSTCRGARLGAGRRVRPRLLHDRRAAAVDPR